MRAGEDDDLTRSSRGMSRPCQRASQATMVFQPAEAALRLGQRVLAARDGARSGVAAGRQVVAGGAQFIEGLKGMGQSLRNEIQERTAEATRGR